MADCIVNDDFCYYLMDFLSLQSIVNLATVNNYLHSLIVGTPLFKELSILKQSVKLNTTRRQKLIICCEQGLLHIFKRSYADCNLANLYYYAAENQHLHVLRWLIKLPDFSEISPFFIVNTAATYNHLFILEWVYSKGKLIDDGEDVGQAATYQAAVHGHLAVLDWLEQKNHLRLLDESIEDATKYNQLAVLTWFEKNGYL